ncbi:MAG: hypothetical protein R6V07_01525 [Armatimonadota bacterium]
MIGSSACAAPADRCIAQNDARWLRDLVDETRPTALFFGHRHKRVDFDFAGVPVHGVCSVNWNSGGEPVGGMIVDVDGERAETHFVPTS